MFPFQLTPGFVILCGANIVGNIISAENRSNLLFRAKPGNPASNLINDLSFQEGTCDGTSKTKFNNMMHQETTHKTIQRTEYIVQVVG